MPHSASTKSVSAHKIATREEAMDPRPVSAEKKATPSRKKQTTPKEENPTPAPPVGVRAFSPVTPWHKRPCDVLLFGPTGFTGAKVLERLGRMDLAVGVAGRDAEVLSSLVEKHGNVQLALLADVNDHDSMVKAFKEARVVINCVGPFLDHGHAAVAAAIEARSWIMDPSGEQAWSNQICRRHREISEAGIVVVTGLAAMPGLGDLAIYMLTPAFEEIHTIHVGYIMSGTTPAKGTLQAIARYLGEPGMVYEGGFWRVARLGELTHTFRRQKEKLNGLSYPAGEAILAPRHMEVENVFGYVIPQVPGAMLLKHSLPQLMRLMTPEVGKTLSDLMGRLPEGLFHPEEHHNHCATLLDVEGSLGGESFNLKAAISAEDTYDTTADLLAYGAYFLVFSPPKSRGVLSPAQAFDGFRLINSLATRGVSIDGALDEVLQGFPTKPVLQVTAGKV